MLVSFAAARAGVTQCSPSPRECRVPVKQLMVKKSLRLPSERFQRIQFICRNYIIKLKAAKLSRFLSDQCQIFQHQSEVNLLDYFFLPKSLLLLVTAVSLLLSRSTVLHITFEINVHSFINC